MSNFKWQYGVSILLSLVSQVAFFGLAFYHTDSSGRSWILFHQEHWILVFILNIFALVFYLYGIFSEIIKEWTETTWEED